MLFLIHRLAHQRRFGLRILIRTPDSAALPELSESYRALSGDFSILYMRFPFFFFTIFIICLILPDGRSQKNPCHANHDHPYYLSLNNSIFRSGGKGPVLAAIFCGVLGGIAPDWYLQGILLRRHRTVAKMIQKTCAHVRLSQILLVIDASIITAQAFCTAGTSRCTPCYPGDFLHNVDYVSMLRNESGSGESSPTSTRGGDYILNYMAEA